MQKHCQISIKSLRCIKDILKTRQKIQYMFKIIITVKAFAKQQMAGMNAIHPV